MNKFNENKIHRPYKNFFKISVEQNICIEEIVGDHQALNERQSTSDHTYVLK